MKIGICRSDKYGKILVKFGKFREKHRILSIKFLVILI